jgi:hypothetical protein
MGIQTSQTLIRDDAQKLKLAYIQKDVARMELEELEESVESLIASMRQYKLNFRKLGDLYFDEENRILKLSPDETFQQLIALIIKNNHETRDWRKTCLLSLF